MWGKVSVCWVGKWWGVLVDRETVLLQSRCGKSSQNRECHCGLGVYRGPDCKRYVLVFESSYLGSCSGQEEDSFPSSSYCKSLGLYFLKTLEGISKDERPVRYIASSNYSPASYPIAT